MFSVPRVNVIILLIAPFITMGAIKALNTILPAKYYFSFSEFFKQDNVPFIADHPGVNGAKLCAALDQYGIDKEQFANKMGRNYISCSAKSEDDTGYVRPNTQVPADVKDEFLRAWYLSDEKTRTGLAAFVRDIPVTPLTESELNEIIANSATPTASVAKVTRHYAQQIVPSGREQRDVLYDALTSSLASVEERWHASKATNAGASDNAGSDDTSADAQDIVAEKPRLSDDEIAHVKSAHSELVKLFENKQLNFNDSAITKREFDVLFATQYETGRYSLSWLPINYYSDVMEQTVYNKLRQSAEKRGGLEITAYGEREKAVVQDITLAGIGNYVLSAVIRCLPVFAVGIGLGLAFGYRETFSIGVAGFVTALMLAWPALYLWEQIVSAQYLDLKPVFAVLYALYMLAFFITAYSGAVLGVYVRGFFVDQAAVPAGTLEQAVPGVFSKSTFTTSEVALGIVSTLASNAVVFFLGLAVPLYYQ